MVESQGNMADFDFHHLDPSNTPHYHHHQQQDQSDSDLNYSANQNKDHELEGNKQSEHVNPSEVN